MSKPTVSLALQSLLEAGLVREASHDPGRPSYGAVFFEPVPEAALVLGLDLGARFVRGAVCDLTGSVRARQDVELPADTAEAAIDAIASLHASLLPASGLDADLVDGTVVGVPGVVDAERGRIHLTHFTDLEGRELGTDLERRLGLAITLENDINLAALGEQWQGVARGVDDFVFLSIGTGMGAGVVLGGDLHRGRHGAAGEIDFALIVAERLVSENGGGTSLAPPYDPRAIFAAARAGDSVARAVVEEVARRIALHIVPIAAVADVGLVVLGGGIAANGDLLLAPIRDLLEQWLPYPPKVEVSSLGDAAVLTGALAVGLEAAQDNVFANRRAAAR
ncbi:MAG: ROK family protein [Actinobacteria bacterium]|nr:MAG: ROK family protein [Actinomycetota bacterium]